jgi:hypothetical protein
MSHAAVATAERHRPAGGRSRAALRRVRDDADRPQTFGQRCHQRPPVFRRPPALRPTLRTPKIGGAIPSSAISVPAPVGSHVVPAAAGHRQQPMRSIRLLCRQGWTVTGVSRPTACGVAGRRKRPGDVRNVVDRIHRRRTTNLVSGRNLVRDSSPSRSRGMPDLFGRKSGAIPTRSQTCKRRVTITPGGRGGVLFISAGSSRPSAWWPHSCHAQALFRTGRIVCWDAAWASAEDAAARHRANVCLV